MVNDPMALHILLARCLGTLEGLYATFKFPQHADKKLVNLIRDIKKAPIKSQGWNLMTWDNSEGTL